MSMSIHGRRGHSAKARISDYTFSLTSLDSLLVSGARASKVTGGQLKLRDSDVTLNGPWTLGMIHNAYPAKNGGSYLQLHSIHILPISSPKYPILHSSEALKQ